MAALTALAPAKVNLFLHVGPVQADGYHPLTSLVAFADVGDVVSAEAGPDLSLSIEGPFAGALDGEADNLVLRALRAFGEARGGGDPRLACRLDKRLPVAAGLGGGSSDAGAALRLANRLTGADWPMARLAGLTGVVGADGPMCLYARSAWAEGYGERITFEDRLPPLPAVLVNPGVPSPTGAVYRAFDRSASGGADLPPPPPDWTVDAVIGWLAGLRNDLQAPAIALEPAIGDVMRALQADPDAALVRMSGSGATVFALCRDAEAATRLAARTAATRPDWWVAACTLGGPGA